MSGITNKMKKTKVLHCRNISKSNTGSILVIRGKIDAPNAKKNTHFPGLVHALQ